MDVLNTISWVVCGIGAFAIATFFVGALMCAADRREDNDRFAKNFYRYILISGLVCIFIFLALRLAILVAF